MQLFFKKLKNFFKILDISFQKLYYIKCYYLKFRRGNQKLQPALKSGGLINGGKEQRLDTLGKYQ